jgi:hypothetical protein
MTGPIDEPEAGASADGTPPPAWGAAGTASATGGTPAWVAPEVASGSNRRRGCAIGCVVVAAVLGFLMFLGIVAVIFLGGQAQSILKGSVEFGTGGTGCSVNASAGSFPAGANLHFVAWLSRDVAVGETITVVQTYPDGTSDPTRQAVDSAASCLFGDVVSGPTTGRYTIEVRSGTELLASGGINVTP